MGGVEPTVACGGGGGGGGVRRVGEGGEEEEERRGGEKMGNLEKLLGLPFLLWRIFVGGRL